MADPEKIIKDLCRIEEYAQQCKDCESGAPDVIAAAQKYFPDERIYDQQDLDALWSKLIQLPGVEDLYIKDKAAKGCDGIISSAYNPNDDYANPQPGGTETLLRGIKNGGSIKLSTLTKSSKTLYEDYRRIFFGCPNPDLAPGLSIKISKLVMKAICDRAGIKPWSGIVKLLFKYADNDLQGVYQKIIELGGENFWTTFGWGQADDPCNIFVPKDVVNGSRFASIIMVVEVDSKPYVAVLYLGSLRILNAGRGTKYPYGCYSVPATRAVSALYYYSFSWEDPEETAISLRLSTISVTK